MPAEAARNGDVSTSPVHPGQTVIADPRRFPDLRDVPHATLADLRGWSPPIGVQFEYSLVERTAGRGIRPMAEALDVRLSSHRSTG
jgi:hypothetical protein